MGFCCGSNKSNNEFEVKAPLQAKKFSITAGSDSKSPLRTGTCLVDFLSGSSSETYLHDVDIQVNTDL